MIIMSEQELYEHYELIEELCFNYNGKIVPGNNGEVTVIFENEIDELYFEGEYRCALENNYLI